MRHSVALSVQSVVASEISGPLTAEQVLAAPTLRLKSPSGRAAEIRIARGGDTFEIAVVATNPSTTKPTVVHPEWYFADHIVCFLNPTHDHATRWMFAISATHPLQSSAEWIAPGEEHGENVLRSLPKDWSDVQSEFVRLDAQRYFARIRVTAPQLKRTGNTPVGLELKVGFAADRVLPPLLWPEPLGWAADTPLQFGDVFTPAPAFVPGKLEMQSPMWGEINELRLSGALTPGAATRGMARIEAILPGDDEKYAAEVPWTSDDSRVVMKLPAYFSPRAKWSNNLLHTARFRLEVLDVARATLWSAEFPFGFDCGIIVRDRFGPRAGKLAPRPSPKSPEFVEEFRQYVLSRIPAYRLRGTPEGAPSDFYLEDPDGRAHLNLSDPNWPDVLVRTLVERFPAWQDTLCAIAAWIYHPLVTRHSSAWHAISGIVSVASIPRLGGCFCGDTARLGGFLAEKVGVALNVPLTAHSMGLRGHLATLVHTPVGEVVIDGMLGYWFHAMDNTRLATLTEMRNDPAVVSRGWCFPRAHGHEFFYGVKDQIIQPWKDTPLVWPGNGKD